MLVKLRIGCIGFALLTAVALMLFWRPISRRVTDWTFDNTTEQVMAALPDPDEREAARELCEALWANIRERGVPEGRREQFDAFRKKAFTMLQNGEVTEEEARAFVERVSELVEELYTEE